MALRRVAHKQAHHRITNSDLPIALKSKPPCVLGGSHWAQNFVQQVMIQLAFVPSIRNFALVVTGPGEIEPQAHVLHRHMKMQRKRNENVT